MKIFFLINSPYPRYAGGIETWLFNVTENLARNHEITVISHERKDFPIYFQNISNKIAFYKFKSLRSNKILGIFIKSYFVLFDLFLAAYFMGKMLKKHLPVNEKCYVIALDSMFCVKAGLIGKSKNKNIKLVSSVRGPHAEIYSKYFKGFSKLIFEFERKMLNKVDCIWSNGYDTIEIIQKKGFQSKLMKNGIDFHKLNKIELDKNFSSLLKNNNRISIVSVGTLLPIKGITELIISVSELITKEHFVIDLFFIGKGKQENFIRIAQKNNIEKNVHFLGHQKNPIAFVKSCKISACLSGGSGMSMAAIESMASGIPIIAWDSPVYKQFNREKQTMLLVKEKDITALTSGLKEIIENYDNYLAIAENARNEAKKYDWEIVCQDLINNLRNDC